MNQLPYSSIFIEFVKKCISCLENSGINYVIVGGVVLSVWGKPRESQDVDVILSKCNDQDSIQRFQNLLKVHRFGWGTTSSIDRISELFENKHVKRVSKQVDIGHDILACWGCRLQLSIEDSPLDHRALVNRKRKHLLGLEANVESPEDLIIGKIKYGTTPHNLADTQSIVNRQQTSLNLEYLRKIAYGSDFNDILDVLFSQVEVYWLLGGTKIIFDVSQDSLLCTKCQQINCYHIKKIKDEKFIERNRPIIIIPPADLETRLIVLAGYLKRENRDYLARTYQNTIQAISSTADEIFFKKLELDELEELGKLDELKAKAAQYKVNKRNLKELIEEGEYIKVLLTLQQ